MQIVLGQSLYCMAFQANSQHHPKFVQLIFSCKNGGSRLSPFCCTHGLTLEWGAFVFRFPFKTLARGLLGRKGQIRKIDYEEAAAPNN
jgi:hypothetical protein